MQRKIDIAIYQTSKRNFKHGIQRQKYKNYYAKKAKLHMRNFVIGLLKIKNGSNNYEPFFIFYLYFLKYL